MSSYIISKDIDLSDEFDEMSIQNQKNFIKDKFNEFSYADEQEMLEDIVIKMPDYNLIKVIQKAFDSLSSQYQAEMLEYIEDSNIV